MFYDIHTRDSSRYFRVGGGGFVRGSKTSNDWSHEGRRGLRNPFKKAHRPTGGCWDAAKFALFQPPLQAMLELQRSSAPLDNN